ncbi:MAG: zinc ribbon domain-containing protein [Granulosicoccus sp.]|nr:zinc ribbon domain-containing protein [Granulosicoccus sp.]
MPVYQYHCDSCGQFEKLVPMSQSRAFCECPDCHSRATRRIAAPFLALVADNTRKGLERNERAQHEPVHSQHRHHNYGSKGGSKCGCSGQGGKKISSTVASTPSGSKMFPTKRPWMISH